MQTISEKAWFNAIATNDIPKVQMFLDQGIDVNLYNYEDLENPYFGSTALHIACIYGYLELVKLLLTHNADIQILLINNDGEVTALHLATQELHRDVVEILLQSGADVHARNQDGNTALLIASSVENESQDNEHQEIIALLLQYGADIHVRDNEGHTVLRKAVQARNSKAVKLLVNHGADVNEKDENKCTLLHHAIDDCCVGCDEDEKKIIIKTLLSHGIDIDAQDARGLTALDYLILNSDEGSDCYRLVKWLLMLGANANVQDKHGNTALHWATEGNLIYPKGFTGIVKLLIQYGADARIKNNNGKTAYAISVDNGNTENSLTSQLLSPESWLNAVISNNIPRIKVLLDQGINVNTPDVIGYTALHRAANAGNKECVKLLLAHGADVHAKNKDGETARTIAMDRLKESLELEMRSNIVAYKEIAELLDRYEKSR